MAYYFLNKKRIQFELEPDNYIVDSDKYYLEASELAPLTLADRKELWLVYYDKFKIRSVLMDWATIEDFNKDKNSSHKLTRDSKGELFLALRRKAIMRPITNGEVDGAADVARRVIVVDNYLYYYDDEEQIDKKVLNNGQHVQLTDWFIETKYEKGRKTTDGYFVTFV